jgi:hypothetical protein
MRTGTRTVPKPVWKEVEKKFPVAVPYCEKRTGVRTVLSSVPVTRTRVVTVDLGHWEVCSQCALCKPRVPCKRDEAVKPCAACKPCVCKTFVFCAPPIVAVCTKRVWVPKLVEKAESYTVEVRKPVEVPFEYEVTRMRTEIRTRLQKVCEMVPTEESFQYAVTLTRKETRTRTVIVRKLVPEQKTRTVNETVLVPRQKIETFQETVCRTVAEKRIRKEAVCVPVRETRDVQVAVRQLVPKTVEVKVAVKPICVVPSCPKCVVPCPKK